MFRAEVYGPLDRRNDCTTTAAESFLSKKLCSRFHSIEVEFYSNFSKKRKKFAF